jgi:hypothetical protein
MFADGHDVLDIDIGRSIRIDHLRRHLNTIAHTISFVR